MLAAVEVVGGVGVGAGAGMGARGVGVGATTAVVAIFLPFLLLASKKGINSKSPTCSNCQS